MKNKDEEYQCSKCQEISLHYFKRDKHWHCLFCGAEEKETNNTITLQELRARMAIKA